MQQRPSGVQGIHVPGSNGQAKELGSDTDRPRIRRQSSRDALGRLQSLCKLEYDIGNRRKHLFQRQVWILQQMTVETNCEGGAEGDSIAPSVIA